LTDTFISTSGGSVTMTAGTGIVTTGGQIFTSGGNMTFTADDVAFTAGSSSQQEIDSSGGTITIQSERGRGTTVELTLPVAVPEVA